ncbi:MAG: DnaJ domain-containing protein [Flavipsychrobacter sp.]|nr:DnaJ domain-containing protein [Flavipsychrobacter sp.]
MAQAFKDYYAILGITYPATTAEIKAAYIRQCKHWHPDRNPGVDTTRKMQEVNEAGDVLLDAAAKNNYDYQYQLHRSGHASQTNTHNYRHTYDATEQADRYAARYEALKSRIAVFRQRDAQLFSVYVQQVRSRTTADLVNCCENWYNYSIDFMDMVISELHENRKFQLMHIYGRIKEKPASATTTRTAPVKENNSVPWWAIWLFLLVLRGLASLVK